MKSKRIALRVSTIAKNTTHTISLVQIEAYAIEYFDFRLNGLAGYSDCLTIDGNKIKITIPHQFDLGDSCDLIIYYHGIRDYEKLFYFIDNSSLRKRMATFYQDAEICFDNALWLPFSLMCGGIFEGLLTSNGLSGSFCNMIKTAKNNEIITDKQIDIMNNVRNNRNLIHANNHKSAYITRTDAMDIRLTLDKMIDNFSQLSALAAK